MMKNISQYTFLACLAVSLWSCGGHFITDKAYRQQVHNDFLARKELAAGRADTLFSVFDRPELSVKQKEALEFLYAYMPLCDLSEYDGDYFLRQVDGAFRARAFFRWGKTVPETIFRHFVLVHRVNNEYMDEARDVFFAELSPRIKDLSMYDAALEVNHWCHEKVNYRGTDARTSSPTALVRTSWGRCGEESTFTVTALRAVGIPARQCYTPRWAHTDDNHAWVEVWVDGRWHYMGACEPEPELNKAWFDGPVKRAMMTHTTVYGRYDGPETKNIETPLHSVVNTLSNYAPTRRVEVSVVDSLGNPLARACVKFKVYNYAELSPIVTLRTDANGKTSLETGFGDLMVWADNGETYGYARAGVEDSAVRVVLGRTPGEAYAEPYVLAAPAELPFDELPQDKIAANAIRLAREDSIRNAYMASFPTEKYARDVAREVDLDGDSVWRFLHAAQGNWPEIERFIRENGRDALYLLATLREKDLRDTPARYLESYLWKNPPEIRGVSAADAHNMLWDNVISPRIGYELIVPFTDFRPVPDGAQGVVRHIGEHVRVSDPDNYYNCRQTPRGVHTLCVADAKSRDIYFVAMCRAQGIPSRLDPETGIPQYFDDGRWTYAVFDPDRAHSAVPARGKLTIHNDPSNVVTPGYGSHFTIGVFRDGDFQTLGLENRFEGRFPVTIPLDEGYYRLIAASRAHDGSATIEARHFTVSAGKPVSITVTLPDLGEKLFVQGIVDMNSVVAADNGHTSLKNLANGQGVLLCFADPDKEPTKHILQELPAHAKTLETWGGAVVLMIPDDNRTDAFDPGRFTGLPAQTVWATDSGRELLDRTASALGIGFRNNFPLVVYLTRNGGIVFSSEGYRIGLVEEVVKTIRREQSVGTAGTPNCGASNRSGIVE